MPERIVWGMRGAFGIVAIFLLWVAAWTALAEPATITATEAESLVRIVLRHEKIRLSPRYCELERLDHEERAFVPDYYSFGAHCDYPNTAATTSFGIYVVSPRTGDVWEFNRCKWFKFPELLTLQRDIKRRTHATDGAESTYRRKTGCADPK
jgi:hypothetical protein